MLKLSIVLLTTGKLQVLVGVVSTQELSNERQNLETLISLTLSI